MEQAGVRGAPSLLRYLSKIPALSQRVATVTLPSGERLSFTAYDHYWCRYLYAGKPNEPNAERIFRRLGKGRVMVDCGANPATGRCAIANSVSRKASRSKRTRA
jgi:hypothetical protein